jgi:pSer/pThr/pTyr-binding forkhead associated (FHA) protein
VNPIYDLVMESSLYALTDANRVDVLRFGRHPDQDVQLLDMRVSREHGLVIYSERLPLFCDYGTLIEGKHGGSTNGTYVDGARPIRDTMIEWLPSMSLQVGTGYRDRNGASVFGYRITYELHTPALPVDDDFGN